MQMVSASSWSFAVAPQILKWHIRGFGTLLLWSTADPTSCKHQSILFECLPSDLAIQVRMSGQDSERGTFNQRHNVLYDQKDGHQYASCQKFNL